jgi:predicted O-linked N-acetylglucosamine transferase (SPINDLY family)
MNSQFQLMLQQAIQSFQAGDLGNAELILVKLLRNDQSHLLVLHILGLIKGMKGDYREALVFLSKAAQLDSGDASIQYNLAKAYDDSGDKSNAIIHYTKALNLNNNFAEAWSNKGALLNKLKRYDEAIAHFDKALELRSDIAETWFNKANALNDLKRYDEAIAHFDKALSLQSDFIEALCNKGALLNDLKRFDEAIAHYDKALSLNPDFAEGWLNKANTLNELKRFDEALAHFDKALAINSNYVEPLLNKANTLFELKLYKEAIVHYDKALSLKPDFAEAWLNKGSVLKELKYYDEAIAHYDKALNLKPDIDWVTGYLLNVKSLQCSWGKLLNSLKNFCKQVMANEKVSQPFSLLALVDDPVLHKKSAEIYIESKFPFNDALGPIPKHPKSQKIRIAYFSADFRKHAVAYLIAELFELHDKTQFELIGFSFGPTTNDDLRQRLAKSFDQFIEVGNKSDAEVARLSRTLKIDIAVDLNGFTQDSRTGVFAHRAAPIQVNYLGYPGTMGADYMDYIIADQTLVPPELVPCYSEKVVCLPNSYQVNDRKRLVSERQFTRKELGLPEDGFVFCCFNNSYKILPSTFDVWMKILKSVDGSVLWLLQDNHWAVENLKNEALNRGVEANRLIFAERMQLPEHLARHRQADLFLDTLPYNAHTTASDALWVGLPVLTSMGKSFASRVSASLLNAVGLPELITRTQEEFEAIAIELATNPKKLAELKLKLANNRLTTPLFDTPLFTKNLEAAYLQMYERYQQDLKPDHFFIN